MRPWPRVLQPLCLDLGPSFRELITRREVIEHEVGLPDCFKKYVCVQSTVCIATESSRFDAHKRQRRLETTDNREKAPSLVCRPGGKRLRSEITSERRVELSPSIRDAAAITLRELSGIGFWPPVIRHSLQHLVVVNKTGVERFRNRSGDTSGRQLFDCVHDGGGCCGR